jgi:ATP-dependent 26S proteasome regulatory subunit
MASTVPICETLSQKRKLNLVTPSYQVLTHHRGLFAIKDYRDSINQDDFNKAVRKMAESKKLEGKLDYQKL